MKYFQEINDKIYIKDEFKDEIKEKISSLMFGDRIEPQFQKTYGIKALSILRAMNSSLVSIQRQATSSALRRAITHLLEGKINIPNVSDCSIIGNLRTEDLVAELVKRGFIVSLVAK